MKFASLCCVLLLPFTLICQIHTLYGTEGTSVRLWESGQFSDGDHLLYVRCHGDTMFSSSQDDPVFINTIDNSALLLVRTDEEMNLLWSKELNIGFGDEQQLPFSGYDYLPFEIRIDDEDNVFICLMQEDPGEIDGETIPAMVSVLIKFDQDGNYQWHTSNTGNGYGYAYTLQRDLIQVEDRILISAHNGSVDWQDFDVPLHGIIEFNQQGEIQNTVDIDTDLLARSDEHVYATFSSTLKKLDFELQEIASIDIAEPTSDFNHIHRILYSNGQIFLLVQKDEQQVDLVCLNEDLTIEWSTTILSGLDWIIPDLAATDNHIHFVQSVSDDIGNHAEILSVERESGDLSHLTPLGYGAALNGSTYSEIFGFYEFEGNLRMIGRHLVDGLSIWGEDLYSGSGSLETFVYEFSINDLVPVSVEEFANELDVLLSRYDSHQYQLQFSTANNYEISVHDIQGRVLQEHQIKGDHFDLDLSNAADLIIVVVKDELGKIARWKLANF